MRRGAVGFEVSREQMGPIVIVGTGTGTEEM